MATISEALAIALQHHQAGRLEAAEQIYRRILQVEPEQPDALHFLGVLPLFTQAGRAASRREGEKQMEIKRSGSRPSGTGPAEYFTGAVRIDPLFDTPDPGRALGVSVTFEPGARTAWHTHPLGQTLIVTAGCGSVQRWGGPVEEIRPGDVIWFPPGEKHWHGATAATAMTHIAIQEKLDGKTVDWMEQVTDEQYPKGKQ
jgi:quercetin dioxygenase-like cupin family protein